MIAAPDNLSSVTLDALTRQSRRVRSISDRGGHQACSGGNSIATECDLILTSPGVSVGDLDPTRDASRPRWQAEFWKVNATRSAAYSGVAPGPWLALRVGSAVGFELFVRPVLRKMQGHLSLFRRTVEVTLEEEVKIAARLTHFLRAIVTRSQDGELFARLTGIQSSGVLTSMVKGNALLIVPETSPVVPKGSRLRALMLDQSLEETSAFSI